MDPLTIFSILVIIFSIIIHEVSHGFAAEALGDPTARLAGRLTLNPLPHIDPIGSVLLPGVLVLIGSPFLFGWAKPVPYNPYNLRNKRWGEALVAAAGPGVNILLAVIFGLLIRIGTGTLPSTFVALVATVVYVNLLLALFNLLPVPPLDGSKLLRSVLPWRASMQYERLEQLLQQGGFVVMFVVLWAVITIIGPYFRAFMNVLFTFITGVPFG